MPAPSDKEGRNAAARRNWGYNPAPMSLSCPFCTLPRERILHENTYAIAIRDAFPVSPGHTLIIPKRHVPSFFDTTPEEKLALLELLELAQKHMTPPSPGGDTSPTAQGRTNIPSYEIGGGIPDSFNIGINDGPAAGQTVAHLHIHLIPRYNGDVEDPRGGVRWVIADKAKYWL